MFATDEMLIKLGVIIVCHVTGTAGEGSGIGFGHLEYWVRLKVPMDQALRLYKVRGVFSDS